MILIRERETFSNWQKNAEVLVGAAEVGCELAFTTQAAERVYGANFSEARVGNWSKISASARFLDHKVA